MHIPHQCFTQAAKEVQKYYEAADEVEQSIINHSVTAGALALVPLPGIAEVAMLIAQIRMYKRIHEITGVKFFSDQVFWNIGKFILSQVSGTLLGLASFFVILSVCKWIPGGNFIAGFAQAPVIGVGNYVCGITYYKMLGEILQSGKLDSLVSGNIDVIKNTVAMQKDSVRASKAQGDAAMAGADYKGHKEDAQNIANEAKNKKEEKK